MCGSGIDVSLPVYVQRNASFIQSIGYLLTCPWSGVEKGQFPMAVHAGIKYADSPRGGGGGNVHNPREKFQGPLQLGR